VIRFLDLNENVINSKGSYIHTYFSNGIIRKDRVCNYRPSSYIIRQYLVTQITADRILFQPTERTSRNDDRKSNTRDSYKVEVTGSLTSGV
jgi:hypothetical protein